LEIKVYEYAYAGILDKCLNKHVHSRNLMDTKISLLIITIAVTSMALTPLIMNQPANAHRTIVQTRKESPVLG